eukprot:TRINITY_DN30479_c0_g1_i1.p1 TRINITY_DN30479_c0_g1~~TRINITY_DN30479_c0_g1_i1.p1  ORF type:complete len:680 (+),score=252.67 TRINITY_DN30479_c0_g1_i1:121-2160(+)
MRAPPLGAAVRLSAAAAQDPGARVGALREAMQLAGVDGYIVRTNDPHQSEYIPAHFARREFLTGFTGSAGTALVTATHALLWTDSRYWVQAERELAADTWTLMRSLDTDVPTLGEWLAKEMKDGSKIGFDARCVSVSEHKALEKAVENAGVKLEFVEVPGNLVDGIWEERPPAPSSEVRCLGMQHAGKSVEDKLAELAKKIKPVADHVVLSALDDVAWLFNLRGSDIRCNPVFYSFATVSAKGAATLYVDGSRLQEGTADHLGDSVTVREYGALDDDIRQLKGRVLCDEVQTSKHVQQTVKAGGAKLVSARSPVTILKASKNEAEQAGFRECHRRDGVAVCQYLHWLEEELAAGRKVTECSGAEKLAHFREQQDLYVGPSFETISGAGPNAAVIHYRPVPESCRDITADEIYLCDSGGQYLDGTTDITRTVHFGVPTEREKEAYTLVLKGNIALAEAVFPEKTMGHQLDSFARQFLWQAGLEYGHGTGHGVGSYLCVHEGPFGIGTRSGEHTKDLPVGAVVSNEPGFYEDGSFGIRIENLQIAVKRDTPHQFRKKQYLGFDVVTLVPLDATLIDASRLTKSEARWIDAYHSRVWRELSPLLTDQALTRWLHLRTQPLWKQQETLSALAAAAVRRRSEASLSQKMSDMKSQLAALERKKQARADAADGAAPAKRRRTDDQ